MSSPVSLVLASASPARRATLRAAGIEPTVVVSDVDEPAVEAEATLTYGPLDPSDLPLLLARAKCDAVAAELRGGTLDALVLGCDSVLELDGEVHGKPRDAQEARDRWLRMRGRQGLLHTGHWLRDERRDGTGATVGATVSAAVHFADVTDEEIDAYVATGEPLRVAGAFTLDGLGGAFVERIEGDPHTVVGLSLPLLRQLFRDLGVGWFDVARPPSDQEQ